MSTRNYNSSRNYRRFENKIVKKVENGKKRPVTYTELYKLDGIPTYNCQAVKEFTDQRNDYNRKANALKRQKQMAITEITNNKKQKKI